MVFAPNCLQGIWKIRSKMHTGAWETTLPYLHEDLLLAGFQFAL